MASASISVAEVHHPGSVPLGTVPRLHGPPEDYQAIDEALCQTEMHHKEENRRCRQAPDENLLT
jgi:hypothetical protein